MNSEDINTTVNISIIHIHSKTLQYNKAEPISPFTLPATLRPALRRQSASLDAQKHEIYHLSSSCGVICSHLQGLSASHCLTSVVRLFQFPSDVFTWRSFPACIHIFLGNCIYNLIMGVNRVLDGTKDGMFYCICDACKGDVHPRWPQTESVLMCWTFISITSETAEV